MSTSLGSMLGLDILRGLGRKWRPIIVRVHWLNIRVAGCLSQGNRSPSDKGVGFSTGSSFRNGVGGLNYI